MTGQTSLVAIVVRRIVFFSGFAMLAQVGGVFAEYWSDDQSLGRLAIKMQTDALSQGLVVGERKVAFTLPDALQDRYRTADSGYFARVRTASGAVLFSNCDKDCAAHFLPLDLKPLTFWMTQIAAGKPLNVAGGRVMAVKPEPVVIEVAIVGDRDGVLWEVLAHEVQDHMILPMSLLLVFVLGATTWSIAQALRPVREAAERVAALNPLAPDARLPTDGMPMEIARFTQAVNAAFDRVVELMRSQKLLTSAISHEVRTPLAIARLELEKIDDPRARKVEQDLEALNRLVEQLTNLARLEGAGLAKAVPIQPAEMAEQVVGALAPLVYASGKTIEFADIGSTVFNGHPALVENALRNLVENAVRHSGAGAAIRVEAGPGPEFSVRDDGGLTNGNALAKGPASNADRLGLGLKIVARIAEIHGGSFSLNSVPYQGTTARIVFGPSLEAVDPSRLKNGIPIDR
jgi:signal transduction histidine kinase